MAINSNFRTLSADNMEGVVYARNYLKNSFENNSTLGWNKVSVSSMSGSVPASGSTISVGFASAVTTFTTSTTSALNGKYSLNAASSAAWTAGQGFISDVFTIDRMDAGKVLTISFDYEVASGASNANFSGTLGSQTFMVYVWDATAGSWIQPAGFLGMNQSSGPGRVTCTFQSSVTASQQYRIAVIASVASAGAISLRFDNFTCSRQTAPIGPVVTDWVSFTPTGAWTNNSTYTGRYKRVGDMGYVQWNIALTGAPNAAHLTLNLPSGWVIDTAKLASGTGTNGAVLSYAEAVKGGTGYNLQTYNASTTSLGLIYQSALTGAQSAVNATTPVTWGNGDIITVSWTGPISGWSSNVQLSNDTDTRVVAFQSYAQPTGTLSGSASLIKFGSFSSDTHAAFNTSTGFYTVPVSGYYKVSSGLNISGTFSANQYLTLYLAKNGTSFISNWVPTATGQTATQVSATGTVYCNAGDTIAPYAQTNIGSPAITTSFTGANYLTIERLSGPSVVAASETVAASYSNVNNVNFGGSGVLQTITYTNSITDSHSAMSAGTGIYTVPVSGTYEVCGDVFFSANGATITSGCDVAIFMGSTDYYARNGAALPAGGETTVSCTATQKLNAGQTIYLQSRAYYSAGTPRMGNGLLRSAKVSIKRVGN